MTGIASVITATIIFVSGGGVVFATLLGGAGILAIPNFVHLNDKRDNKNNTFYISQTDEIKSNVDIKEINIQNDQVYILNTEKTKQEAIQSIAPIKQYDDNLMVQKLITIDALSQKEKVLVRVRKKETEENLKEINSNKK